MSNKGFLLRLQEACRKALIAENDFFFMLGSNKEYSIRIMDMLEAYYPDGYSDFRIEDYLEQINKLLNNSGEENE